MSTGIFYDIIKFIIGSIAATTKDNTIKYTTVFLSLGFIFLPPNKILWWAR